MSLVRVTFIYEPDDPDDDHPTGVSNAEFEEKTDLLMASFALSECAEFERMD
jgi:hypothetical protein